MRKDSSPAVRLSHFIDRSKWMAPFAGGVLPAAWSLAQHRFNPERILEYRYSGAPLFCRRSDLQAVKEVIVDKEYAFLSAMLREVESPLVLDVGCHIGTFGLWVLSLAPKARILSVEADPDTYVIASRNVDERRRGGADWAVINRAASAIDGETASFLCDGPTMSHKVAPEGTVSVDTLSLAAALDHVGEGRTVDVLKIDIEGSEEAFLCAEPQCLSRVRSVVVELHPDLCDTARVRDVLAGRYEVIREIDGRTSSKPLLYCY